MSDISQTTGPSDAATWKPLKGLRILDFSLLLPGPFATVVLADLGAEVIKVEPLAGDPARTTPGKEKFHGANRGKRSLAVDLKNEVSKEIVRRLVEKSDVVVEGFRPGVADRLGIGAVALRAVCPRLIYCSISGYGASGPWRDMPGHDLNYLAAAGAFAFSGQWRGQPHRSSLPVADLVAGALLAVSIMCAIQERTLTGTGRKLELSLFDVALFCTSTRFGMAVDSAHRDLLRPTNDLFKTSDGRMISLGANEEHIWQAFQAAVSYIAPELLASRFSTEASRREHGDELSERLERLFATKPARFWAELAGRYRLPLQVCLTPAEAAKTEHVVSRGLVKNLDDIRVVPFPVFVDGQMGGQTLTGAPLLGADTYQILSNAGFTDDEILRLQDEGVVVAQSAPS